MEMTVRIRTKGLGCVVRLGLWLVVDGKEDITIIIVNGNEENHDPSRHHVVFTSAAVAKHGPSGWVRSVPGGALTKWDVAVIVFQILGILAAIILPVVGIAVAILK
jgi:hypothetical protein